MNNIIAWLKRNADKTEYHDEACFYGVYHGMKIRYTISEGKLDVGCRDFDRWANSVACSLKLENNNISVQVNKAIDAARKNTSSVYDRSFNLMIDLASQYGDKL